MKWRKKAVKVSFLGSFHLPALFGTEETRGRGDMPSHNRSLFADFCKKRGQTSIVLELGYKFWGSAEGFFFMPLRLIFCKGNGALNKKNAIKQYCKIAYLLKTGRITAQCRNYANGFFFCVPELLELLP